MPKQLLLGSAVTVVGQASGDEGGGKTVEKVQLIVFVTELTEHRGLGLEGEGGVRATLTLIGWGTVWPDGSVIDGSCAALKPPYPHSPVGPILVPVLTPLTLMLPVARSKR